VHRNQIFALPNFGVIALGSFLTRFSTKILVIRLLKGGPILNGVKLRFPLNNLILTDLNETLYIDSLYEDLAWDCIWGCSRQGQGRCY